MSPHLSPTVAALRWFVRRISLSGLRIPVSRVQLKLFLPFQSASPSPSPWIAWLDTAAPLSIIPFRIHSQGLIWRPIPGVQVHWGGLLCDVGYLDIWLLDRVSGVKGGPFRTLAKFPRADPPSGPSPLLLGLEFVLTHGGEFHMPPYPADGELRVP